MKFLEKPLWVALGISAVLLTIVLISPLGTDDLIYHSIALDFYRFGKIPYLGSWDQNFPGIIFIHYISILLFGESDISIRILDIILQLGFVVLLYSVCRRWMRERTASIAAVLYIFYYVTGRGSLYSERDVYGAMAVVTGLFFIFKTEETNPRGRRDRWELFLAGLSVGFSMLIRPTFGLAYIFIAVFLRSLQNRKDPAWVRWRPVLFFAIIGTVPFLSVLFFYSSIPGGLHSFYLATIQFNLDIYSKYNSSQGILPLAVLIVFFLFRGLLLPFAMVGVIALRKSNREVTNRRDEAILLRSPSQRENVLYWRLLTSFLLIAVIERNFLAYHFAPFYLFLCPLAAIGVEWMVRHIQGWFIRTAIAVGLGAFYFVFMVGDRREVGAALRAIVHQQDPWKAAYEEHHSNSSFGALPQNAVLHFLSLPGNDTGILEICSFEPMLRTHLNRKFASPYIMPTAIAWTADEGTLPTPHYTDYQIAWRQAYIDGLCQNRPQFIILARNTACWYLRDPYRSYLHNLPGFDSLLQASYRYDTVIGCYQIFRRMKN